MTNGKLQPFTSQMRGQHRKQPHKRKTAETQSRRSIEKKESKKETESPNGPELDKAVSTNDE